MSTDQPAGPADQAKIARQHLELALRVLIRCSWGVNPESESVEALRALYPEYAPMSTEDLARAVVQAKSKELAQLRRSSGH